MTINTIMRSGITKKNPNRKSSYKFINSPTEYKTHLNKDHPDNSNLI